MFSFFAKRKASAALINGIGVDVRPGETLLHAALRQGIDFPHSCRVGCGFHGHLATHSMSI